MSTALDTHATNQSYETLRATFARQYTNVVPATALLWWTLWYPNTQLGSYQFGVRIECPVLGKEFTNGAPLGRDPEGELFFNEPDDLRPQAGWYAVGTNTGSISIKSPAVYVELSNDSSTADRPFAKFLAKDPKRLTRPPHGLPVNYSTLSGAGTWSNASMCEAYANLDKRSSIENMWTLTVGAIHKQVTFSPKAFFHQDDNIRVDTKGVLLFKDINLIEDGVYAHYGEGSVVFTTTSFASTDFCAIFIPLDLSTVFNPMGNWEFDGAPAQWAAYS